MYSGRRNCIASKANSRCNSPGQVSGQSPTSPSQVEKRCQSLAPSTRAEAEECFLKAIAIASQQEAKLLELRAVMSLVRLWQQQDRNAEAKSMLAGIYGWFSEGFDTLDLQAAQALLETLE